MCLPFWLETSTRFSDAIFAGTSKWAEGIEGVEGGDEAETARACDRHKQTADWCDKDPAAQDSLHIPHNVRAVSGHSSYYTLPITLFLLHSSYYTLPITLFLLHSSY